MVIIVIVVCCSCIRFPKALRLRHSLHSFFLTFHRKHHHLGRTRLDALSAKSYRLLQVLRARSKQLDSANPWQNCKLNILTQTKSSQQFILFDKTHSMNCYSNMLVLYSCNSILWSISTAKFDKRKVTIPICLFSFNTSAHDMPKIFGLGLGATHLQNSRLVGLKNIQKILQSLTLQ